MEDSIVEHNFENLKTLKSTTSCNTTSNNNNKSTTTLCDPSTTQIKTITTQRSLGSEIFTILIIVYHMVQWIKVNRNLGQSFQQEDEDY